MPSNLETILNTPEYMEDPHQFFMLRQGCDDLIPWKNPDCGSKQNVYKMVKKRKWTELDAEKERREENECPRRLYAYGGYAHASYHVLHPGTC